MFCHNYRKFRAIVYQEATKKKKRPPRHHDEVVSGKIIMNQNNLTKFYLMLYRVLIMIYRSSSAMSVQKIAVQRL